MAVYAKKIEVWIALVAVLIAVLGFFDVKGKNIETNAEESGKIKEEIQVLKQSSIENKIEHKEIKTEQAQMINSIHKTEIMVSEIYGYLKAGGKFK